MIKVLSLAAALAVLPLTAAVAQDKKTEAEAAIEAAGEAFEARMEAFGEKAEAIEEDESLTKAQKEARVAALWAEYQPDLVAFTTTVGQHASAIASEVLAEIDVEKVVREALAEPEVAGAMAGAQGMAANGAWASNDPEHMETYGLMAEYALGQAADDLEEAQAEIDDAAAEAKAAAEAPESPEAR